MGRGIVGAKLGLLIALWGCGSKLPHDRTSLRHDSNHMSPIPVGDPLHDRPSLHFTNFQAEPEETLTTRYPVVLHHGLLGYDQILTLDYFFNIPNMLRDAGVDVYVTSVDPVATVAVRAQQLAGQIDAILKKTGATKVNLIGHSMGGLDARYLVSSLGYGDRVATVTTLASPNHGTKVADLVYKAIRSGTIDPIQGLLRGLTGTPLPCDQPWERTCSRRIMRSAWDIRGVARDLSVEYSEQHFNPENPPDPRVYYQSYSGIASRWGWPGRPPKVEEIFSPIYLYLKYVSGDNDGLVPSASAVFGEDRGILRADHLDIIGHLMGETGGQFDHRQFFKNLTGELRDRGF